MSTSSTLVSWRDPAREVRVQVLQWIIAEPVKSQYIEPPRDLWLVWNYLRRIGVRSVLHKLRSRFAEGSRNRKAFGLGVGTILDAPEHAAELVGKKVLFFAPNHRQSAAFLSIPVAFVTPLDEGTNSEALKSRRGEPHGEIPGALKRYMGWSLHSGIEIDEAAASAALATLGAAQGGGKKGEGRAVAARAVEQIHDEVSANGMPTAVLFGLGNYAKTVILPNIKPYLSLQRVHEVDPDQFEFFDRGTNVSKDTSPIPRSGLRFDAWIIAGFHHTHVDLAIAAMGDSAAAIIEKPLATTRSQFERFESALKTNPNARFFLCFQRRYSRLHEFALSDLACAEGDPVDMHSIVYEIPLPDLHWYNWPNSGSRLISNGCHWIDYFMFVNGYAAVRDHRVWRPRGSDVAVQVSLENGAYLTMTLTDTGSQRLGVRDHIELRRGGVTVKMVDQSAYEAENRSRIFRRTKVNPQDAYAAMYRRIAQKVVQKTKGDSLESLLSSELTLRLEEEGKALNS